MSNELVVVEQQPRQFFGCWPFGFWSYQGGKLAAIFPTSHVIALAILLLGYPYVKFFYYTAERYLLTEEAKGLCRRFHFDDVDYHDGKPACTVWTMTADGIQQTYEMPLKDAKDYELEAFNVQESRCVRPSTAMINWGAIHESERETE